MTHSRTNQTQRDLARTRITLRRLEIEARSQGRPDWADGYRRLRAKLEAVDPADGEPGIDEEGTPPEPEPMETKTP